MRHLSSPRALASTALIFATVQLIEGILYLGDAAYLSLLLFAASFLGALAALAVWRDNRFAARFTLALIALLTIVGHTLSLVVGLPGAGADAWAGGHGASGLLSLAMATSVVVMLIPRSSGNHDSPRYDPGSAPQDSSDRGR